MERVSLVAKELASELMSGIFTWASSEPSADADTSGSRTITHRGCRDGNRVVISNCNSGHSLETGAPTSPWRAHSASER